MKLLCLFKGGRKDRIEMISRVRHKIFLWCLGHQVQRL